MLATRNKNTGCFFSHWIYSESLKVSERDLTVLLVAQALGHSEEKNLNIETNFFLLAIHHW